MPDAALPLWLSHEAKAQADYLAALIGKEVRAAIAEDRAQYEVGRGEYPSMPVFVQNVN